MPPGDSPELKDAFAVYERALGFIPHSVLIMQRRPKKVAALSQLAASVWDRSSTVDVRFQRLLAHMARRTHGCQCCMARTAGAAMRLGVEPDKLDRLWSYQTSPLFTPTERVALDFALAAGSVPNAVDDELFDKMKQHWSEDDIVQITDVFVLFGFMNRWNDTMATPLEPGPLEVGEKHLTKDGWNPGKHV